MAFEGRPLSIDDDDEDIDVLGVSWPPLATYGAGRRTDAEATDDLVRSSPGMSRDRDRGRGCRTNQLKYDSLKSFFAGG